MARSPQGLLMLLLLHYLIVALDYHKANGFSASKDHRQEVTVIEFQEAILACKTPKKTTSSRLEWKKVGQGVSLVYYQQALQALQHDFQDGQWRVLLRSPELCRTPQVPWEANASRCSQHKRHHSNGCGGGLRDFCMWPWHMLCSEERLLFKRNFLPEGQSCI